MLHGPNDHIVYHFGFHNRNQYKVYLLFGCTVGKLGPNIFLQSLFLKTSAFDGIENPLICSGVSILPLPLYEQLVLPSPKEKFTDPMASSSFVATIFHIEKSDLSSSPGANFNLDNSIHA